MFVTLRHLKLRAIYVDDVCSSIQESCFQCPQTVQVLQTFAENRQYGKIILPKMFKMRGLVVEKIGVFRSTDFQSKSNPTSRKVR